jgi:hypothetical protein
MPESESDPKRPKPDLSAAASGFSTASRAMQVFSEELALITQQNLEQTMKVMEELKAARGMSDLLAIQTKFVQDTFETFRKRLHRMSALMADFPNELGQGGEASQEQDAKPAQSPDERTWKPGHEPPR